MLEKYEASTGLRPWYPSFHRRNPPKHPPSLSELRRVPLAQSSMGLLPWSSAKADKIIILATNPADPKMIYAAATLGQIYRSTDGGESWTALKRRLGEIRALAWLPD